MEKSEAAAYLAGAKQVEGAEASAPTNLHVISGEVVEKSENGKVKVDLGGLVFNGDDEQSVEIATIGGLEVGDTATILLSGQEHRGMTPLGVGGVGTVDRIVERVSSIEADYIKTAVLEAERARIDTLETTSLTADSAVIQELQVGKEFVDDLAANNITVNRLVANSAYINNLELQGITTNKISATTGYIDDLTTNNITASDISADHAAIGQLDSNYAHITNGVIDNAKIGHADVNGLSANYAHITNGIIDNAKIGHADVNGLSANYATVGNLTAATGRISNLEATRVTTADLEANYITADTIESNYVKTDMSNTDVAWIQNGTIKDGAITNAMINSLSANKLTAGTINGETINVTNINASNITTGTINGQRIGEGSLSLSKLEEDVYTEQEVDNKLATMQAEIDGAIETWTGTAVPTLQNAPAVNWNTNAIKDTHVGDVYFVVNSQSEQNGYNYRFTKSGNTYSWQLIKDSDVTNALSRLSTAEGKITTFDSDISTLKTDTGTLKTKTESLETRMSDAEDDILDKVDTTTFNEVSDTVDQHSQTITQMSQTLSNKADGSTVTSLTQRVSKNEQDISGINTTIGELSTTVESKADGSTVESVSSRLNTVSNTVDGHTQSITNITSTQTTMQGKLDKTIVESTQLWYTKADTTAPSKPTSQVTSTSTSGGAWRTVVPAYSSSYPNYFYCYQWKYSDGTYGWSSVTRDIAMGESQSTSRTAASDASTAKTDAATAVSTANTASTNASNALTTANTADTNASTALSTANTAASDASTAKTDAATAVSTANTASTNASTAVSTANTAKATADKNVKSSLQLWFTKANETAPSKPTSKVTSTAVSGNGWRTVVPTYSSSYPYYFYCYQYELADGTYTWSDVVYDRATTENQSNSRSAVSGVSTLTTKTNTISDTVDGHTSQLSSITSTQTSIQGSAVKSTVQLWFTKANTTAPNKPTAHVTTNNASTANAWNLAVPTYNASYPYYYYCYEYQYLNDTYGWSAVTRDIATEESQSTSRSAASAAAAADTKAGNAATAAATADGKAVSAQNTADKNVRESQQLWYTKANSTAPAKPTSKVTSTATTGGAWTTRVPTYSDSYKYYFYCMQYIAADGTVTWSDVVYDQATTEAQSVARAASADLTEFQQEYATFKQTTTEFESTVGETYATKTALQSVDDKIDNLEIGGRNLILKTAEAKTSAASASSSSYTSNYTLSDYGSSIMNNTDDEWYCSFDYEISGNSNSDINIYFQFRGSATTVDVRPKPSGNASGHSGESFKLTSTQASGTSKLCRFRMQNATDGATLTISNLKLEKGNRQTDWSPAPEDLETTVSSIEQRVTNAETSITNNATEIGLRAKSSDVYTKQESDGLISTEVTNRNAAITESANAITLSVSQQYVTNQRFDDLKIGGRNLIPSSVFTSVGIDGSTRELGPVELSVMHSNFNTDDKYIWNVFEPETQYTFMVGALATDPSAQASTKIGARFYFRYTDGTMDIMSFYYGVTSVQYQTMTSQAGKTVERFTASYSNAGTTWTFYEMKLEKGNRATDWTPAPEDLATTESIAEMQTSIEQNAEQIALRATKTEASQMAQPNLAPYFSMPMTATRDDYWANVTFTTFTQLEDGWAHFEYDNNAGRTVNNYIAPKVINTLEAGGQYTLLVEFRNVSISIDGGMFYSQQNEYSQVWGTSNYGGFAINNSTIRALENGAGAFYASLTLLTADSKDPSGTVRGSLPKQSFMYINQQVLDGQSISYDIRLSLYEGEYTGPYKPYVGSQLYASQAELKVASDAIDLKVSKNDVINQINVSTEGITIDADRVNITGAAIFTSGRLSESSLNSTYDANGAAATVQTNLNNLQIGGRNLLLHSGDNIYANNPTWNIERRWSMTNTYCTVTFSDNVYTGTVSNTTSPNTTTGLRLVCVDSSGTVANNSVGNSTNYGLEMAAGDTFTFSVDLKTNGSFVRLVPQYYNGSSVWTECSGLVSGGSGSTIEGTSKVVYQVSDEDWHRYYVTFTIPSNFVCWTSLVSGVEQADGKWISARYFKLEKGNKATAWTPAPEDQTLYVDNSIAGISIGGRNLYAFTNASVGYIRSSSPVGDIVLTPNNPQHTTSDYIPVSPGDVYTVQLWNPNLITNSANSNRAVCWYDSSKNYISFQNSTGDGAGSRPNGTLHWSFTSNPAPENAAYARFGFIVGPSTNTVDTDIKVKVEKGTKPTDWTPAPEDVTADALTSGIEYIEGTQTAATNLWTGVTKETALIAGKSIAYKLPYAGTSTAATLNLTLAGGGTTGAKAVKMVYSTSSNTGALSNVTTHWPVNSIIQMTYDGTQWVISNYNTNVDDKNAMNVRFYNTIVAGEALAAASIIGMHADGKFYQVKENATFLLSAPLLWLATAKAADATNADAIYTHAYDVNLGTYYTSFVNTTKNCTVYLVGTVSGNTFSTYGSSSAQYLTVTEPTTEDGRFYIPLGRLGNASTGKNYFNYVVDYPVSLYAYIDGKFRQVTPTEIVASHRIYWRSAASTKPTAPTTWIAEATQNTYDAWTTKIPPLSLDKTSSTATKYLYLYTCEQRKRLDGTIQCTDVQLDENTTVIDGGNIITNTVTANQLSANAVTADKIAADALTLGKFTDTDKLLVDNSQVQVGGRNLLYDTADWANWACTAQATVSDGVLTVTNTATGTFRRANGWFIPDKADIYDKEIVISFDAKKSSDTPKTVLCTQLFMTDKPYKSVASGNITEGNRFYSNLSNAIWHNTDDINDTTWTRVYSDPIVMSEKFSTNYNNYDYLAFYIGISSQIGTAHFRNVKIECGTRATDWSPAPEDVDGSILFTSKNFNDQIAQINSGITKITDDVRDHESRLATTEGDLDQLRGDLDNLTATTQWLSFNTNDGLVIGDSNNFYTRQLGSVMTFNQVSNGTAVELMSLSGTDGIAGPKVTVSEQISTPLLTSDTWSISLSGDMFTINYIGS